MRSTLVAALVACSDGPSKVKARRFLLGLSADELQFIAEYVGACILESTGECSCPAAHLAVRLAEYRRMRRRHSEDRELKLILLREYLGHTGVRARVASN